MSSEGKKGKNSRETSIDRSSLRSLSLDVSIYLCNGKGRGELLMALNQDSRVWWAVSTSWQTPFDTRDQLPDRAFFARQRERKKEKRKRKGGGNRLTLHVTQIGTVDRNGDCSMKRNGALRDRFAPPNGYSMKRFTRWWFINNVVYLMVYRMVRWSFVRLNRRLE